MIHSMPNILKAENGKFGEISLNHLHPNSNAKGVVIAGPIFRTLKGLSAVQGNSHAAFLEEPSAAMQAAYSTNKRGTAIKVLIYDGNGFWLCQKRFSSGKLKWWPTTQSQAIAICAVELLIILQQGNPQEVSVPDNWRTLQ